MSRRVALTVAALSGALLAGAAAEACGSTDFVRRDGTDAGSGSDAVVASDAPGAETSLPDGETTNDGGTKGDASGDDGGCPSAGGAMIRVKPSSTSYCIDRTEVTNGAYAAFLAANVPTTGQDPECQWNGTYARGTSGACSGIQPLDPALPVACVNYCDAVAFCKWAGKVLCGAQSGGPVPLASTADPGVDQWFGACSAGGARLFPYGATYDAGACNGAEQFPSRDAGPAHIIDAGSLPTCVGGYPGLYDMSGNLMEWERRCTAGDGGARSQRCTGRGGSYTELGGQLPCTFFAETAIDTVVPNYGFRCCAP